MYPSIPLHRLPDAHRRIRARLGVVQDGYARWNLAFVAALPRRRSDRSVAL
jgi:fatty acid desaturase